MNDKDTNADPGDMEETVSELPEIDEEALDPDTEGEQEPEEETPLTEAEREISELKDKLLRSLADMENLRRRAQRDREEATKFGMTSFARDMLAVSDNLGRAIASLPEGDEPASNEVTAFVEGVELTQRTLLNTLEQHGIEKIEPEGEKFDPQFHEAMFELPSADVDPGTVVQVLESGYLIHGRLLRPARVAVAKAAAQEEQEPAEPSS